MNIQIGKKTKVIILSILTCLVVLYLGLAFYYSERFFMRTKVNGINCSGMKLPDVKELVKESIEKYNLTIRSDNTEDEEICVKDFDLKYKSIDTVEAAMKAQNAFAWPVALFKENNLKAKIHFDYDRLKIYDVIADLSCMKEEHQVPAVASTIVLNENRFEIIAESLGTVVDVDQLRQKILDCVSYLDSDIALREDGCYVEPKFYAESEEVVEAAATMNLSLDTKIVYKFDGKTVELDSEVIREWITVDEDMNIVVSEEGLSEFTKTLAATYNTEPRSHYMTTPTGKSVYVKGATKGRAVDKEAEKEQLKKDIFLGRLVNRQPFIAHYATPEGQYAWGRTYVEVDISAQHMWYIKNGSVIFECDVVTGSPGRDTPTGIYEILTKKRDKVLKGEIDPVTGKREYETPVDYWARVTWTGIGFHDATWQPAFGGQLYKQGYGSHGCINMPYNAVKTFYGLISVGNPVIIHY